MSQENLSREVTDAMAHIDAESQNSVDYAIARLKLIRWSREMLLKVRLIYPASEPSVAALRGVAHLALFPHETISPMGIAQGVEGITAGQVVACCMALGRHGYIEISAEQEEPELTTWRIPRSVLRAMLV